MNQTTSRERRKGYFGEANNDKHYQLITTIQDRLPRFSLIFADGRVQQQQYNDLHSCQFSAEGDALALHIAYSPVLICKGRNLLELESNIRKCTLARLEVYREGYHENIPDKTDPVIESIAVLPKEEKTA